MLKRRLLRILIMDNPVDLIFNEIVRQYEIKWRLHDSRDQKAQFLMGIIILFLGYLITQKPPLGKEFWFYIGVLYIFAGGLFAFKSYIMKKIGIGPDIDELIDGYENSPNRDYRLVIMADIQKANKENTDIILAKTKELNHSFILTGIGVLLFLFAYL